MRRRSKVKGKSLSLPVVDHFMDKKHISKRKPYNTEHTKIWGYDPEPWRVVRALRSYGRGWVGRAGRARGLFNLNLGVISR